MRRLLTAAGCLLFAVSPDLYASPSSDRLYAIASMLSGTFEGSTPGNHLVLRVSTIVIEPQHPFDLFLSVTGTFQGGNVQQQGVIRLEAQGSDVYFTYIPHFNPLVTALSNDAGRFTERELTAACSFTLKPRGDGFVGDTLGAATCAQAMRGATGKWMLEIEPGNLRVRNVESGETLRFRQVGKADKN